MNYCLYCNSGLLYGKWCNDDCWRYWKYLISISKDIHPYEMNIISENNIKRWT